MPVNIIDTLKQKNNGDFPIVEAIDVAVTAAKRLNEVLNEKADLSAVASKASTADVETATDNLQAQINELITPVTQDAEVENARVDSAGITFTTLKERLDYFERLVKEDFQQFGSTDASFDDKSKITFTHNGITYAYDSLRNKYKISGTVTTAKSFYNALIFEQAADIPDYIIKGDLNYIHFATTDNNIKCVVYQKRTGDSEYTAIATINNGDLGSVYIADDVIALIIRFEIALGVTVETYAYANLAVVNGMTNGQLSTAALKSTYAVLHSSDLNDVTGNNIYLLSDSNTYTHAPVSGAGVLVNNQLFNNWQVQFFIGLRNNAFYKRDKSPTAGWNEWGQIGVQTLNALGDSTSQPISQKYITDNSMSFPKDATPYTVTDPQTSSTSLSLSNIKDPGYYVISSAWTILDAPPNSRITGCKVEKYKMGDNESFLKQTVETISGNIDKTNSYFRFTDINGDYQAWKPTGKKGFIFSHPEVLPNNTDLNQLSGDETWLMADSSGGQPLTYYHAPYYNASGRSVGILTYTEVCGWDFQLWYNFNNGDVYRRLGKASTGVWRDWMKISGSGQAVTYNVTQNINRDEISNTYTITTLPTITTDTNGWLQAVDTDTSDETNKTDMSGAILSMLTDTGYCHLAPGIYYVSGFDMPAGSTIEGCGKKTIIRLLSSVTSGYAVRIGQNNTVKNICFSGGYAAPSDVTTVDADLGSRHGIYLIANADGEESTQPGTLTNIIEGCFFENFNGSAFYNHNTGGGMDNAVIMSDCRIVACKVGLNIDYYGEYSKFTSVIIKGCNHACINNGGNNVFTGCTFHGVVGFLIDNTGSDKRNIAHGSCVGCTFNHIDNMNRPSTLGGGDAILIKNAANGFLFNDSQIWYGKINIQNSPGISINNGLIGGGTPEISVVGDYGMFMRGCTFMNSPSISANSATKLDNCYLASTGAPVINQ